jgi:hypothetical protein
MKAVVARQSSGQVVQGFDVLNKEQLVPATGILARGNII